MGVYNLWSELQQYDQVWRSWKGGLRRDLRTGQQTDDNAAIVHEVQGKVLAIDTSVWIFQASSQTKLEEAIHNEYARVLLIFTYRLINLLRYGVTPVFVLEGAAPDAKHGRLVQRSLARGGSGFVSGNRRGSKHDALGRKVVQLLDLMGLPYVEAPGEAEAMCAALNAEGLAAAAVTSDVDALLFGAKTVYRECRLMMDNCKENLLESVRAEDVARRAFGITGGGGCAEALQAVACLCGCDYAVDGGKGVGVKSAMEVVQALTKGRQSDAHVLAELQHHLAAGPDPRVAALKSCSGCKTCGHEKHGRGPCEICGPGACRPKAEGAACQCAFHASEPARKFARAIGRAASTPGFREDFAAAVAAFRAETDAARRKARSIKAEIGEFSWSERPDLRGIFELMHPLMSTTSADPDKVVWSYGEARNKLRPVLLEWDMRQGPEPDEFASEVVEFRPRRIKAVAAKDGGDWAYLLDFDRLDSVNAEDAEFDRSQLSKNAKARHVRRGLVQELWPHLLQQKEDEQRAKLEKPKRGGRGKKAAAAATGSGSAASPGGAATASPASGAAGGRRTGQRAAATATVSGITLNTTTTTTHTARSGGSSDIMMRFLSQGTRAAAAAGGTKGAAAGGPAGGAGAAGAGAAASPTGPSGRPGVRAAAGAPRSKGRGAAPVDDNHEEDECDREQGNVYGGGARGGALGSYGMYDDDGRGPDLDELEEEEEWQFATQGNNGQQGRGAGAGRETRGSARETAREAAAARIRRRSSEGGAAPDPAPGFVWQGLGFGADLPGGDDDDGDGGGYGSGGDDVGVHAGRGRGPGRAAAAAGGAPPAPGHPFRNGRPTGPGPGARQAVGGCAGPAGGGVCAGAGQGQGEQPGSDSDVEIVDLTDSPAAGVGVKAGGAAAAGRGAAGQSATKRRTQHCDGGCSGGMRGRGEQGEEDRDEGARRSLFSGCDAERDGEQMAGAGSQGGGASGAAGGSLGVARRGAVGAGAGGGSSGGGGGGATGLGPDGGSPAKRRNTSDGAVAVAGAAGVAPGRVGGSQGSGGAAGDGMPPPPAAARVATAAAAAEPMQVDLTLDDSPLPAALRPAARGGLAAAGAALAAARATTTAAGGDDDEEDDDIVDLT